jgi:hypothetical protein
VSMVEVEDEEGGDELMGSIRAAALGDEQDDMSEKDYLDMMQQIEEAVIAEILEQGSLAPPLMCARVCQLSHHCLAARAARLLWPAPFCLHPWAALSSQPRAPQLRRPNN